MRQNAQFQSVPVKYSVTNLGAQSTQGGGTIPGGLDLTTPTLSLHPGALRDAVNFECRQTGGYSRIEGYERYDGQQSPSSALYTIVQISAFNDPRVLMASANDNTIITTDGFEPVLVELTGEDWVPPVGSVVTQAVTGAFGSVVYINNVPGSSYLVLTKTSGTFDTVNALICEGDIWLGTAIPQTVVITPQQDKEYLAGAANVVRTSIQPVPGSGITLGVVNMVFQGVAQQFAFRANVAGDSVLIYRATNTGWVNVPLLNISEFTNGTGPIIQEGDILSQGPVSAVVRRVMLRSGGDDGSGNWTGDAVGALVLDNPSGGDFAAGTATTLGGATITLAGAQAPITILPGGRYQFEKCNFYGQASTKRIYGCDGVNKCFEFDGEVYSPITTGLTIDAPTNIKYHIGYLVVSREGSLLHSGPGTPFMWSSVLGGGEIAVGDDVTSMISMPGNSTTSALFVFCGTNTLCLYGKDPTTFNLVSFNTGIGGIKYSSQNLMDGFVLDAIGIITLRTTLNYGNFEPTVLTKNITPFLQDKYSRTTASCVSRLKSQYRVFFSNGYGAYLTMVNQTYLGTIPVYFPNPVYQLDVGVTTTGNEVIYFTSSDGLGYVYQLDIGTSFDGADLPAYATLAIDTLRSPRILKRFRACSIEVDCSTYTDFKFGYQLGYGSTNISQPNPTQTVASFSGAQNWDDFTWDSFIWDGRTLSPTEIDMTGTGENVQVTISTTGNYIGAYTLNSIIYHYTPRRGLRV